MIRVLFFMLFGWLGMGLVISLGCLAAWYFIPEVPWLTSKARRLLLFVGIATGAYTIGLGHGTVKGVSIYQASLTKQINKAIATGDRARAEALNRFDATKEIEDDGFARD
jgi:hypothetical protein